MNLPGSLFLLEVPGVHCDQAGQDLPETAREQSSSPVSPAHCTTDTHCEEPKEQQGSSLSSCVW